MSDYEPNRPPPGENPRDDEPPVEYDIAAGAVVASTDDDTPAPSAPRTSRRRLRRICVAGGVAIVAGLFLVAVVLFALIDEHPPWWRSVNVGDPATVEAAEIVENHLISVASRVRDMSESTGASEDWGISVVPDQANAWLNTRLRDWVANQQRGQELFKHILEVQVDFGPHHLVVGAKIRHHGAEKVFSATLVPELRDDGSLWLVADRVHVGRLSLPGWILTDLIEQGSETAGARPLSASRAPLEEQSPALDAASAAFDIREVPEAREMFAAFAGRQAVIREPLIRLPDGRRIRLIGLDTRSGQRLVVMCRTELRPSDRARIAAGSAPTTPE